jgi:hypothetical protein
VELFQHISNNNYTVVYLTARSIAQDQATREYLFEVRPFIRPKTLKGFNACPSRPSRTGRASPSPEAPSS